MRPLRVSALALVALALAALALAGCGGDDGGEEAAETPPAETGAGAAAASGEAVFTANCAGCHTLEAAGASGQVGPDLDELQPDADRVAEQVRNGGGGMPAFADQLTDEEIQAVADYVAENAGG